MAEWERFPCAAHMINHAVKNGLDNGEELPEIKTLIDKCKSIVTYFKYSGIATHELKKAAESRGTCRKATALVQEVRNCGRILVITCWKDH